MKYLRLRRIPITDYSFLGKFIHLEILTLGHNEITNIEPLEKLTGLLYLDLDNDLFKKESKERLKKKLLNCKIRYN